jgi:lambda repressor-like predicted transcriptional regulator
MNPPMHPDRVNCELRIRGYTHKRLAEELNISRAAVSTGIRTGSRKALRDLVSKILSVDPALIWPNRYSTPENALSESIGRCP